VSQPLRIVIVGGGTAGWMTAAAFATAVGAAHRRIHLIESSEIGIVGVGEATLPHIRFFNRRIGIDERELMARTQATFKLGIEFVDWARLGDRYIHPFGAYGSRLAGIPFHQHWLRRRAAGDTTPIDEYSLPIVASRLNRFSLPSDDPTAVMSTFGYAFQFDASLYAAYLREFAERRGVQRTDGRVIDVKLRPEDGAVDSVKLSDGAVVEGDLFIDCSGFRGLIIEQALKTGYDEWTRWLPCDRAAAVPCENHGELTPYTRATAREAGWQWRIPLQHRTGNGYVYSSQFISDDEAATKLLGRLDGKAQATPRLLRFTAGRRRKTWNRNCVAIGLSGGFLEPLESTSIYLIQIAITTLIDYLTDHDVGSGGKFDPRTVDAYNRWIEMEYDRVRDFLILHYHAIERDDAPLWQYCRHMAIPDSLAHKMELFRERGHVITYKDGLFLEPSWLAVYFGQRVMPRAYDSRVDAVDAGKLAEEFARVHERVATAAARMPRHEDFIRQYCPAKPPALRSGAPA
jgi:tryptophan halogenase